MSSPKTTNLEQAKKSRSMRGGEMSSTGHAPVYHAAHGCDAASLSLTAARLRGLKWACSVESQKNAGVLALVERDQHELGPLSHSACMLLLCLLKGGRLIALVMQPHGKDVGWEADEVPCRSFSDFLPPNWTCAFQRIQLSSIAVSPCIHGFHVHQLDLLSSHRMPVLDVHVTRSTEDQGLTFPCCHDFHPSGFVAACVVFQVFERPDVVGSGAVVPCGDRPSPALRTVRAACHRTRLALYALLERLFVREYACMKLVMAVMTKDQCFPVAGRHHALPKRLSFCHIFQFSYMMHLKWPFSRLTILALLLVEPFDDFGEAQRPNVSVELDIE